MVDHVLSEDTKQFFDIDTLRTIKVSFVTVVIDGRVDGIYSRSC